VGHDWSLPEPEASGPVAFLTALHAFAKQNDPCAHRRAKGPFLQPRRTGETPPLLHVPPRGCTQPLETQLTSARGRTQPQGRQPTPPRRLRTLRSRFQADQLREPHAQRRPPRLPQHPEAPLHRRHRAPRPAARAPRTPRAPRHPNHSISSFRTLSGRITPQIVRFCDFKSTDTLPRQSQQTSLNRNLAQRPERPSHGDSPTTTPPMATTPPKGRAARRM